MKWNWGTGIAVSMGIFMLFIVIMVVKASRTDTELQYEDYYEQELDFQVRIDALENAKPFKNGFEVILLKDNLSVNMSEELIFPLNGYITFFRPNDQSMDLKFDWTSNTRTQAISVEHFIAGHYTMEVHWNSSGKEFLLIKEIEIPKSW
jgi:hypothetical protein